MTRRGLALTTLAAVLLTGPLAPLDEVAAGAAPQARRAKPRATPRAAPQRADLGHVRPDRVAARAHVDLGGEPGRPLPAATAGAATPPEAPPPEAHTAKAIEALLRGPLRQGTTSLFVADADTGEPVFSVFPDERLNPASNVKLISTAAALDLLGPEFRYTTWLLGEAPGDDGTMAEDLYLRGSYDPTLDRAAIGRLASDVVALGTRRFAGDVVVGDTPTRDGVYRSWVDLRIEATEPGAAPRVTMTPATDFVVLDVQATTARKKRSRDPVRLVEKYVTDDAGRTRLHVTVRGQVGRGRTVERDVWIRQRALHAAHLLRAALREAGVEVTGDVRVAEFGDHVEHALSRGYLPVPLARHTSKPLREIVARVNKRSTNWLADRVIMTAAARRYGGKPSMELAVTAMYEWLARRTGLTRDDLVVDSGSGLSYRTELSARQVVTVLRAGLGLQPAIAGAGAGAGAPPGDAYRASLAVGGVDGTIRRRFKQLPGTLLGKTGTLARVVSLAGLLEAGDGRRLVFAVVSNGHQPRWKTRVRDAHEQLVGLLCAYLHASHQRELPPALVDATTGAAPVAGEAAAAADEPTDEELEDDEAGVTEHRDGG